MDCERFARGVCGRNAFDLTVVATATFLDCWAAHPTNYEGCVSVCAWEGEIILDVNKTRLRCGVERVFRSSTRRGTHFSHQLSMHPRIQGSQVEQTRLPSARGYLRKHAFENKIQIYSLFLPAITLLIQPTDQARSSTTGSLTTVSLHIRFTLYALHTKDCTAFLKINHMTLRKTKNRKPSIICVCPTPFYSQFLSSKQVQLFCYPFRVVHRKEAL